MAVRRAVFIVVLSVTVITTTGAHGLRGGALAAPAGDVDEEEARRLFKRAEINFNMLKFSEALADYQAAYQAKPLPGFLFNIAQCHRNVGQYERARFFFRRYLVLDPRTSDRRRVEDLIAEMTRLIEKQGETPASADANATPGAVAGGTTPPSQADRPAPSLGITNSPEAVSSDAPLLTRPAPPVEGRQPVYKKWWFWSGIGAVVVGGAVATFLLTRDDGIPDGSLDPINAAP